jgi:hypothetical protein
MPCLWGAGGDRTCTRNLVWLLVLLLVVAAPPPHHACCCSCAGSPLWLELRRATMQAPLAAGDARPELSIHSLEVEAARPTELTELEEGVSRHAEDPPRMRSTLPSRHALTERGDLRPSATCCMRCVRQVRIRSNIAEKCLVSEGLALGALKPLGAGVAPFSFARHACTARVPAPSRPWDSSSHPRTTASGDGPRQWLGDATRASELCDSLRISAPSVWGAAQAPSTTSRPRMRRAALCINLHRPSETLPSPCIAVIPSASRRLPALLDADGADMAGTGPAEAPRRVAAAMLSCWGSWGTLTGVAIGGSSPCASATRDRQRCQNQT